MAWAATLNSILVDTTARAIKLEITVTGGALPYPLSLNYAWDDITFREGDIRDRVRKFIENMKAAEETYNLLKTVEGQEIPLGV